VLPTLLRLADGMPLTKRGPGRGDRPRRAGNRDAV